ncbi:hypothetical protein [Streptomyces sp. NBC_00576]|uniref:hypothetical protein n=1 Tax=Streptomyces sp. NBC_00576 TaxID=2903665 RepID=UPI002E807CCB|nr:hypothetical protein [Streptomyces sp. NBC_00576]WUB76858.1 hypothetical protein OG734_46235 [Streptomyces sp. NBC_00576]
MRSTPVRSPTKSRFACSYASRAHASSARIASVAPSWPGLKEWAFRASPNAVIPVAALIPYDPQGTA